MKRIWKDASLHLECNSCWMDDLPLNVWHFVNKIWWKGSLKTSEREEFFVQRFFSVRSVWKILTSALQTHNTSVEASSLTFSDSDSFSLNQEAFLLLCRTRTEMLKQFLQWLFIFNCIWSHAKSPNKFPSLDPLQVLASPPPLHSSLSTLYYLPFVFIEGLITLDSFYNWETLMCWLTALVDALIAKKPWYENKRKGAESHVGWWESKGVWVCVAGVFPSEICAVIVNELMNAHTNTLPYADTHTHKQIPICTTNRCSLKCIIFSWHCFWMLQSRCSHLSKQVRGQRSGLEIHEVYLRLSPL